MSSGSGDVGVKMKTMLLFGGALHVWSWKCEGEMVTWVEFEALLLSEAGF